MRRTSLKSKLDEEERDKNILKVSKGEKNRKKCIHTYVYSIIVENKVRLQENSIS